MPDILITDIIIKPNRQRQEFVPEDMQQLKSSIENLGLLQPPVLRKEGIGCWVLVAGERRLRMLAEIFELGETFRHGGKVYEGGIVPFVDIGDLSDLEVEEAELDENLKRKDLTWQEHAAAVSRLHSLRQAQALESADGLDQLNPKEVLHTIADTAREVRGSSEGIHQESTRREIIVARHLDNPAIAKAKSADEAFKILKAQEEQAKNIELARTVGATFNADLHLLVNADCLDFMRDQAAIIANYPAEAFDVICTDPPYGMGADSFGDGAGKLSGIEHHYDDSFEHFVKLMTAWAPLSYAVCKPQAHAYVFCDPDNFHFLRDIMREAGWYVFRTPLINHKLNSGRVPLPDRGPRRQYEIILYAIKGKKPVTHIYPDVLSTNSDENLTHGAQKPVAVYQNLLQRSVRPGDRVFDPFAGTGPIFEAANGFKCSAVGCELNTEYYALSLKRIQRLKSLEQPSLL